jgi:hypothetical protein
MSNLPIIGADPEGFIYDTKKKEYISAGGLIPGTKEAPHKVKQGAIQVDGVAVEFNINPAASAEEFVYNIETVKTELTKTLKESSKNLEVHFIDTIKFKPKYFETIPKEDLVVGCDPDFYCVSISGGMRVANVPNFSPAYRFAGGHVHIGNIFNKQEDEYIKSLKQIFFGVYFSSFGKLLNNYNTSKTNFTKLQGYKVSPYNLELSNLQQPLQTRRSCGYANLGRMRPKTYGLEYRSPNNYWVQDTKLQESIFNEAFRIACFAQTKFKPEIQRPMVPSSIPSAFLPQFA